MDMTLVYARISDRTVADEYFRVTEAVEANYRHTGAPTRRLPEHQRKPPPTIVVCWPTVTARDPRYSAALRERVRAVRLLRDRPAVRHDPAAPTEPRRRAGPERAARALRRSHRRGRRGPVSVLRWDSPGPTDHLYNAGRGSLIYVRERWVLALVNGHARTHPGVMITAAYSYAYGKPIRTPLNGNGRTKARVTVQLSTQRVALTTPCCRSSPISSRQQPCPSLVGGGTGWTVGEVQRPEEPPDMPKRTSSTVSVRQHGGAADWKSGDDCNGGTEPSEASACSGENLVGRAVVVRQCCDCDSDRWCDAGMGADLFTLYVASGGTGDCSSQANACGSIQTAITTATGGSYAGDDVTIDVARHLHRDRDRQRLVA